MTSTNTGPYAPFFKASHDGDLDTVTRFLDSGVDYLEGDTTGKTALHWAVENHQLSVVNALLDHHGHAFPTAKVAPKLQTITHHDLKSFDLRARATITPIELAAQVDDEVIFKVLLERLEPFSVTTLFNGVWPPLVSRKRYSRENMADRALFRNDNFPIPKEESHPGLINYILRLALKDDKLKVVEMLLRIGADANAQHDGSSYLPLDVAALHRPDPAYIRLLLKYGANPNPQRTDSLCRLTPLSIAIEAFNEQGVMALLEGGASVNASNGQPGNQLSTVCHLLLTRESLELDFDVSLTLRVFRALLDAGGVVDTACLSIIVRFTECLPLLKELVARGVDITSLPCALNNLGTSRLNAYRETLEIFASAYGTPPRLRAALLSSNNPQDRLCYNVLLWYGLIADDPMGQTNLEYPLRTLAAGLRLGDLETALASAHSGSLRVGDPSFPWDNLEKVVTTPEQLELFQGTLRILDHAGCLHPVVVTEHLFQAVQCCSQEDFEMEGVLEGLLVMGARMRRKPEGSPEPHQAGFFDVLALAAIHGKEKVLSLLLQKLPWPQLETPNPHHPAWPSWFRQEEFDLLRQVYDNDVDTVLACLASDKLLFTPNLADTECPLLVAVKRGDLHAVQTLIALGVNVDEQGRHGWTPLHAVAQWEHEAIADALLQANASVHARARRTLHFWLGSRPTGDNSVGWTPLHVAAYRGNLAVIKKLLDYGADVHAIEYCGGDEPFQRRTALDMVLIGGVVDFDNLDGYGKRWLHPDRLTAALLLMEHGATFSARVAMAWTKLEVDEIVEIFGEHSSLWDKFVAEDWGDVDEPEPEPMSDYDDYEDYY